jgi:hypothetical protein
MHPYRFDAVKLEEQALKFIAGQCLIHNKGKVLYKSIQFFREGKKVKITFAWLRSAGRIKKEFDKKITIRWDPVDSLLMEFHWIAWYYQDKRKHTDRDDRLKLHGWREHCRFYLPTDPSNISNEEPK